MIPGGKDHALAFLCALHPQPTATSLIQFVGLTNSRHAEPATRWHWDPACTALDEMLELNARGFAAYVGVNPRATMAGGERTNIRAVHALPIDVDTKKTGVSVDFVRTELERIGLGPSMVIESGNGGHLYLLLDRHYAVDEAEAQGKRLVWFTRTDAVWNASRIMRLPGTVNWKEPPTLCYVKEIGGERYSLAEIAEKLHAAGVEDVDETPMPAPIGIPPQSAVDAVNMLPTAIAVLVKTGNPPGGWNLPSASEADWIVCRALVLVGSTDEQIADVYSAYPIRNLKVAHAGSGYLERTVRKAREDVAFEIQCREQEATLPNPPFYDAGGGFMTIRQTEENSLAGWAKRAKERERAALARRAGGVN